MNGFQQILVLENIQHLNRNIFMKMKDFTLLRVSLKVFMTKTLPLLFIGGQPASTWIHQSPGSGSSP